MTRYICIAPCWHGKRRYRLGDTADFDKGEYPVDKNGKIRHFVRQGGETLPEPESAGLDPVVRVNDRERKGK
jgi:hypothetical protein